MEYASLGHRMLHSYECKNAQEKPDLPLEEAGAEHSNKVKVHRETKNDKLGDIILNSFKLESHDDFQPSQSIRLGNHSFRDQCAHFVRSSKYYSCGIQSFCGGRKNHSFRRCSSRYLYEKKVKRSHHIHTQIYGIRCAT